ncbi:MAG: GDSL-type esterase/lipase family protein [Oscillospiraceae bacterium]|jgi:lysophospholipase L1-like esterase|nr:GDSL-type esterase/lipase family protein [Oscillospiraceae bacterium]
MRKEKAPKSKILRHIVSFAVVLAAAACIIALNNAAEHSLPVPHASPTPVAADHTPITFTPIETVAPKPTMSAAAPVVPEASAVPTPSPTPFYFTDGDGDPIYAYTYGEPVPENELTSEDWWNDAVFIGNSLTDGFKKYSGIKGADIFAATSISVNDIRTRKVIPNGTFDDEGLPVYITIVDAVKRKQYGKIYIMLGLNELGLLSNEEYKDKIDKLLLDILKNQPNAVVYLESTIPVETDAVFSHGTKFNNDNIRGYNEMLKELAAEREYFYVDLFSGLADEEGNLPPDFASDDIHPYPEGYKTWLAYLVSHTIRAADDNRS